MFAAGDDYVCHLVEHRPCVSLGKVGWRKGLGRKHTWETGGMPPDNDYLQYR